MYITKARNYGQVETCLANQEPFDHSTMSARWVDGTYRVRSYWTTIAEYDPETGESEVSENYWGQTTARHIGACRRALPRVRSNDPSALDGIGPGSRVSYPSGPVVCSDRGYPATGRVAETYPLAGRVVIEPDSPTSGGQRIVKDRAEVALA